MKETNFKNYEVKNPKKSKLPINKTILKKGLVFSLTLFSVFLVSILLIRTTFASPIITNFNITDNQYYDLSTGEIMSDNYHVANPLSLENEEVVLTSWIRTNKLSVNTSQTKKISISSNFHYILIWDSNNNYVGYMRTFMASKSKVYTSIGFDINNEDTYYGGVGYIEDRNTFKGVIGDYNSITLPLDSNGGKIALMMNKDLTDTKLSGTYNDFTYEETFTSGTSTDNALMPVTNSEYTTIKSFFENTNNGTIYYDFTNPTMLEDFNNVPSNYQININGAYNSLIHLNYPDLDIEGVPYTDYLKGGISNTIGGKTLRIYDVAKMKYDYYISTGYEIIDYTEQGHVFYNTVINTDTGEYTFTKTENVGTEFRKLLLYYRLHYAVDTFDYTTSNIYTPYMFIFDNGVNPLNFIDRVHMYNLLSKMPNINPISFSTIRLISDNGEVPTTETPTTQSPTTQIPTEVPTEIPTHFVPLGSFAWNYNGFKNIVPDNELYFDNINSIIFPTLYIDINGEIIIFDGAYDNWNVERFTKNRPDIGIILWFEYLDPNNNTLYTLKITTDNEIIYRAENDNPVDNSTFSMRVQFYYGSAQGEIPTRTPITDQPTTSRPTTQLGALGDRINGFFNDFESVTLIKLLIVLATVVILTVGLFMLKIQWIIILITILFAVILYTLLGWISSWVLIVFGIITFGLIVMLFTNGK